ncbi:MULTISPECIES: Crp/Fnr family transcriptional regulator [unclassified Bradyrhizobium]|uniref:Crp/Fnr family transcriptional regulator n=1 Tax=unclassified Bradyrhizobium TaxID=2631580 RepID=UPI002FEE9026
MKKSEAFEIVSSLGWLSKQPIAFRTRLASDARVRSFEPAQVLFEAGDPAHSLIGLASGTLEVSLDHPQFHLQLVHIARPGTWLGQATAYGSQRTRSVSVRAKTKSSAIVISRQKIEAMIEEDPLCLRYFALLSELHLHECLRAIAELSQRDSFCKVCARLISLGVSYVRGSNARIIEIPVSHDEFASLCGISRKTLERVLGELKQNSVIDVHYRSITILDLKKLSAIAAGDNWPRSEGSRAAAS